ncbi:hypothetical protein SLS64_007095 [Diaporthe eres]|uniref:Mediator complex subunit 9 n=1 Tax=Diaporthe eres TaxID=83184 RepID=A0ABR1PGS9_DIAER
MASTSDPDANPHALPAGLTPDSVDVPSELYTILSRLRYADKNGASTNGDGDSNKPGANTPAGGLPGSTPSGGAIAPANGTDTKTLSTKDLTAATDPLKHKIQRARAAVHTLPDITRTIPEQEAEIKEWQDKIESQRKVLQQLKEFGIQFSHGSTDAPRTPTPDAAADSLAVSGATDSVVDTVSTVIIRDDRAPVSSPVTPTPKGRNVAAEAEGDVAGNSSGVGSQTTPPDRPLQPDIDAYGSGSHIEDTHQAQAQSHSHAASKPIPFRIPASTGQLEDHQDDDPFSDAGRYEAVGAARVEQETKATGSKDVVCENAVSPPSVDAGQVEDSVTDDVAAPHVIDEKPYEQSLEGPLGMHGASTAASVLNTMETEPEKEETPVLEAIGKDTQTAPLPHPHQHYPTDIVGKTAVSSSPIDRWLAEESTVNSFVASHVINREPHEQLHGQLHGQEQSHEEHGANMTSIDLIAIEVEPEKEETAVLQTIDEDMRPVPPPHSQQHSPAQSFSIPDAQPASPKEKEANEATAEPASDNESAASSPDAPKCLVTIPIPLHYHEVRNYLWFKKSMAAAQPAPETQTDPRTPSPKKPPKKAPGTSGSRHTRASKKTPSKAPADDDNWSPRLTRSAKKAAKEAEAAATQAASPPPRATPVKKIILHFTRKPKVDTDDNAAPETEAEESSRESMETSDEPAMEVESLYDGRADEPDPDADENEDEDADAEEEVMLL